MNKYVIVAESGADLPGDMIERYNIHIATMHVEIGGEDYPDVSISIKEICDYYDKTGKVPKTAAANPYDYQQVYEKIGEENPDAVIIHPCYSYKLSATYQNSTIAEDGKCRIYHADSLNASIGQAFVVMKTAKLIEENPEISPEEIVRGIDKIAAAVRFSFVPGNLDFLRAGGRVSNAQHLGATIFRLKPLIQMIDGNMITTKKYMGNMNDITRRMIDEYFDKYNIDKDIVFLSDTYKLDKELKANTEKQVLGFGVKEVKWIKPGGVITSHSGSGAIGIAGIENI